ncbi:MAG: ABC transporter permease subunit [Chloroflexota bacterium]
MAANTQAQLRQGRRKRLIQENLTAYAFLFPAGLIIFTFGLFPVMFAFFVSLHQWRRFPDQYIGLGNYTEALGSAAYVAFFWVGLAALGAGLFLLWRLAQTAFAQKQFNRLLYLIPGVVNAGAVLVFVRWFALLLPVVLNIPQRIRGQAQVEGIFIRELVASFQVPEVVDAANMMLVVLIAAIIISIIAVRVLRSEENSALLLRATGVFFGLGVGYLLLQMTGDTISSAVEAARAAGTELPLWSQIVLISAGAGLLGAAYWLWTRGVKSFDDRRFLLLVLAGITLAVGGYILIGELPRLLSSADSDMLGSFAITVLYAILAVPFQLAIGLGLAYLLFQNLKGKTFFRMIFFLPYIMPFIATSVVFTLLFSHRQDSIVNHVIGAVGIAPQKWLLEPTPIGKLIFGAGLPDFLNGPSLALLVIIIYTIWTYAGYDAVVFLAGLGNISPELYEAARIDGANGWQIFRRITLPLLSPTTFFLSLIAVIGTFQAFTQLWMMRNPASNRTTDTLSIYIFRQITDASPNYGYGSALAFVLFGVILVLTIIQNRAAQRRVFYG